MLKFRAWSAHHAQGAVASATRRLLTDFGIRVNDAEQPARADDLTAIGGEFDRLIGPDC